MSLYKEARRFVLKQRIDELRRANQHWPNSNKQEERSNQIDSLIRELQSIDEEK